MSKVLIMRPQDTGLDKLINYTGMENITMIEIGCYAGESTKFFLDTNKVQKIYCVDPWEGGYDNNDIASHSDMKEVERLFDFNMQSYEDKIIKIKQKSTDAIKYFKDNNIQVDLVYIDGDHRYDGVWSDLNAYYPLVKKNGFIAGHDYSMQFNEVRLAVNNFLNSPEKLFPDTSWIKKKN